MKLFSKKKNNQAQQNISIDNLQSEIKYCPDEQIKNDCWWFTT